MATDETFSFSFDEARLARLARPFGIRPETASVTVAAAELRIDFGPWRLRTPLTNVVGAEITGPYTWWKVAGPAHMSFADRGVTFASSTTRGVCIRFVEAVPALLPLRRLRHPAATVTVERPEALLERLTRPA